MATPRVNVPLPERTTNGLRIIYPRQADPITAVSYSSRITGIMMHWGALNSFPCTKLFMPCVCQSQQVKTLWYGWLACREKDKRGRCLMQLTESAVKSSLVLSDSRIDLRGATVILTRISSGQGSIVRSKVTLEDWKDHSGEEDPDVFALLCSFYKIRLPQLGDDYQAEGGEV